MQMTDPTLVDFGASLTQLIEATLTKKSEELLRREELVLEREHKVEAMMKNNHSKGHIELRVGNKVYHTTTDILLSVKDTYFYGLLHPEFTKDEKPLFIARDGKVFKYILEYLTYGQIFSRIPDDGTFELLVEDAQFYLLSELSKQLKTQAKQASGQKPFGHTTWLRVGCTGSFRFGGNIPWNQPTRVPASHFKHKGDTITILKAGLYHIFLRYEFVCSTHGQGSANMDILVNGAAVARLYHGVANGYYDGRSFEHLQEFKQNDRIQIKYHSNSNGNANGDSLGTSLTILCLSAEDNDL